MELRSIAGHELTPGKTVKDHIHVEGTELHVPHVLLCGQRPGPTVLVSAGIHNAEYVGIQAAIELSNELDVSALRGNVIIVPLANRSGFENRTMSRVFEDGKNLNRVFPGDREGSEADRLAHMLFEVFIRNVDAYIDLHSGDGYETLMPFASGRYPRGGRGKEHGRVRQREVCRAFPLPYRRGLQSRFRPRDSERAHRARPAQSFQP